MKLSYLSFVKTACDTFDLTQKDFEPVTENLISKFTLELPRSVLEQAQNIVADIHRLTQTQAYITRVAQDTKLFGCTITRLPSLLCSLDVHIAANGELKIIEINTNASGYLINTINAKARAIDTFPNAFADIQDNFLQTIAPTNSDGIIAIVDETPEKQKLFIEFQMYQKMIQNQLHRECHILDPSQITTLPSGDLAFKNKKITGIYNRHTDFYLHSLPTLKTAHDSGTVLLSPHPWGYATLADKRRMVDLQNADWCPELDLKHYTHLEKALLKTVPFAKFASVDELWQKRHHYFFKPADSYGSKSVYNGKSISRKKFDEIYTPNMLAQETVPAPIHDFVDGPDHHLLKYDLRFFFFEGKVQLAFARLYEGQLTNLQSPVGGHAPLVFT